MKKFIEMKKVLDERLARLPEGIDIEYEIIKLEPIQWDDLELEEDFICDSLGHFAGDYEPAGGDCCKDAIRFSIVETLNYPYAEYTPSFVSDEDDTLTVSEMEVCYNCLENFINVTLLYVEGFLKEHTCIHGVFDPAQNYGEKEWQCEKCFEDHLEEDQDDECPCSCGCPCAELFYDGCCACHSDPD